MCLDISFKVDKEEDSLYDYLPNLKIDPQLSIEFENISHIAAHSRPDTKVIYSNHDHLPYLTLMRWGLLKAYMFKDPASFKKYAFNSFNARAESIMDSKSTWYPIRKNRCLIDTPGIYEHRKINGWKNKVPYYVRLANHKRFLIPALYYYLQLSDEDLLRIKAINDRYMLEAISKVINLETGEVKGTYAMITREANKKMSFIHNDGTNKYRMPLFLPPEKAVNWINPTLTDDDLKEILSYKIESDELETWPVFTIRSGKQRPDHKEKFEFFQWQGLPELGNDDPLEPQQVLF
ncbi:MAG: SOS response-associated peptidase family protein [Bacteroidetes bacterium]|nr:SOS response-associated peptidase family protein [Bacteroidota bacterium]